MKYNLGKIEEFMESIRKILERIKDEKLWGRKYTLYLSGANNEKIVFPIIQENLPHLLGIKTNYLASTGIFSEKNSYKLFLELLDNAYRIHKLCSEGHINQELLFSDHIEDKIDCFFDNMNMEINNIDFICEYDYGKLYGHEFNQQKCDYVIVKTFEDGRIGLLTLAKNGNICSPVSNRVYKNYDEAKEELRPFLTNQKLMIVTGVKTDSPLDRYEHYKTFSKSLTHLDKIEKADNLKLFVEEFNCSVDVLGDYKFCLGKYKQQRSDSDYEIRETDYIEKMIQLGKIVDIRIFSDNLERIANAYNDFLSSGVSKTDTDSYTQIKQELLKFKEALKKADIEIERLTLIKDELQENLEKSEKSNEEKSKRLKLIYETSKPSE